MCYISSKIVVNNIFSNIFFSLVGGRKSMYKNDISTENKFLKRIM